MSKDGLRRLVFLLWPSLSLAFFSLVGLAFEYTMLRTRVTTGSAIVREFPYLSFLILAGYWIGLAWILHAAFHLREMIGKQVGRRLRLAVHALMGIVVFALVVVIAGSWLAFWRTGYFLNFDILEFAWRNFSKLVDYFEEAHKRDIAIGFCSLIAILFGTSWLLISWRKEFGDKSEHQPKVSVLRPVSLFFVILATTFACMQVSKGCAALRNTPNEVSLEKSHPLLALSESMAELWSEERIEPILRTHELTAIAKEKFAQIAPENIQKKSVIFIAIEAMRHDVVNLRVNGREVMPNVNAIAANSVLFTRAYTQSTHSNYADVCIDSSLLPLRSTQQLMYTQEDPWPKTLIYDLLKPAGYATAHISSQNESWGGMFHFLSSPNLDLFYDPERSDAPSYVFQEDDSMRLATETGQLRAGKFYDEHTVQTAINWIKQQKSERKPFYLSINFQASHFPYPLPETASHPFLPNQIDGNVTFVDVPQSQVAAVRNAYHNALHYVDGQVGKLVDCLKELELLDDVVLVVYGENGESFQEGTTALHASDPVEAAVRVACMIHAPNMLAPAVDEYPFQLVDITPSVLGLLGWDPHPNFQGENVFSQDRVPSEEKLVFIHVNTPLSNCDAVILGGKYKLVYYPKADKSVLTDVDVDPNGNVDLTSKFPEMSAKLKMVLQDWRQKQLAYYKYPFYYQNFYPPKPPKAPLQGGMSTHVAP